MDKKRSGSKLAIFLILIVILAGGYFLFHEENSFISTVLDLDSLKKSVSEGMGNVSQKKDLIKLSELDKKVKEGLNNTVEKGKEKAFDAFRNVAKEGLANVIKTAENFLGIELGNNPPDSNREYQKSRVKYLVKTNEKISFSIQRLSTEDRTNFQYQVNWGDGQKERGELKEEEFNRIVFYSWEKEGNYLVQFEIIDGTTIFDSQAYVVVISG